MAQRAAPPMPRGAPVPPHCPGTGDTHSTQLVPSLLGLWMGCGLCNAQPHSCPSLSSCPWGCCERQAGTRSATGRRSSTSSPQHDQTIRAKASNQMLPPPWETTQQHSRYLPG